AKAAIAHKGVLVSDTVDFSANVTLNTIYRLSCTVSLEAGENEIAIVCVGKGAGNTANVLSLRIDCITYTRMEDKSKTMEGEAHPEWGDVLANGLASSERAIRLDSNGLGAYTDIPLGLPEGVYAITLAWIKTASSPVIAILHDDVAIVEAYDLYAATDKRDTVTLTVRVKGESDHLRILTVGQKKASAGYDVILDCLSVCEKTPLSSKAFGVTVKIGEKINLAEQYTSEDNLVFVNCGETSRNVIKLSGCVLSAEKAGTALVKAYHPVTGEFAELLVTVVDHETPKEILTALDAINASDLTLACSLYEGLSEEAKAFVISYRFLMKTKQIKDEEEEDRLSDIYYLDEMAYTVNEGSTVKKGSCPSGSHEMKFSDSHSAYEHGLGFEPTTDEVGILYVAIPENATVFHAVIGLDHEMSKDGYSYDQQNTVKIWIDGVLWGSTDCILKNTQNGTWKDCTTTFDIEIPEGSSYLVIENDCGVNRICDHILYADACFLAR
ncbi:MAG: NPCBM/NEW2 domain-containing protein, partial [Clostridia bacterium]|nr:NPCBM/NEW2 domain-containing protein [Clostridia bacterium]